MLTHFLRYPLACLFAIQSFIAFSADTTPLEQIDEYIIDSEFQQALDLINRTLINTSDVSMRLTLQNKKIGALTRMGQLLEAKEVLNSIKPALEELSAHAPLRAITTSNEGFLQLNLGRPDLAEEKLQEAMSLFEQADQANTAQAAETLTHLGLVFLNTGKYTQAEQQMLMVLNLRQKLQVEHAEKLLAATYNDLGLVYSQIDKDKALNYYEKAFTLYKKLYGEEHLKIAFASINNGVIYRDIESYGEAVNAFETALKIFTKTHAEAHPTKAIALYNLGQTYLKMRNTTAARQYYQQALDMYRACYGPKHPEVANVLNAMGNLQLADGAYDEALLSYQQALQANVADFMEDDLTQNPSIDNFYNGTRLLQTLLFKAQAFESRYFGHSIKFSDLENALNILQVCDKLVDKLRQQSNHESDKILIGVVANEVYANGVRIAYTAAQNAFKKKTYYEQAFYFAEKSKSAVLLGAISESNAKSFAGIPAHLLDKEKELKSALSLCARQLAQRPAPEEEKLIREKTFKLNRTYEEFIHQLEQDFPDYFNLKFNQASPTITELQAILPPQTTVISYFTDEQAVDQTAHLYIFKISQHDYHVEEHVLPADFNRTLTGFRNGLYYQNAKIYQQTSHALYDMLIPRLSRRTEKLIILPTGRLGVVPFEALLTKATDEETTYQNLPYLISQYSIQYEFSAGLILQKAQAKQAANDPAILLCAPVHFAAEDQLNDLPGTEDEVNEISRLFATRRYNSKLFTGHDASEHLIKSDILRQYNYLHLATHGVVDEYRPELSRIFLNKDVTSEDGYLFAGEIYNLTLNADLVTLSACETGLGKISKGEGVIGLSRALVYAGARNIIVSFWSVADESTSALMKNFYARLLDNPKGTLSEDLRQAKLKLIADDTYASPYYWAPFVLIGF